MRLAPFEGNKLVKQRWTRCGGMLRYPQKHWNFQNIPRHRDRLLRLLQSFWYASIPWKNTLRYASKT